jgi:hypothetical protein
MKAPLLIAAAVLLSASPNLHAASEAACSMGTAGSSGMVAGLENSLRNIGNALNPECMSTPDLMKELRSRLNTQGKGDRETLTKLGELQKMLTQPVQAGGTPFDVQAAYGKRIRDLGAFALKAGSGTEQSREVIQLWDTLAARIRFAQVLNAQRSNRSIARWKAENPNPIPAMTQTDNRNIREPTSWQSQFGRNGVHGSRLLAEHHEAIAKQLDCGPASDLGRELALSGASPLVDPRPMAGLIFDLIHTGPEFDPHPDALQPLKMELQRLLAQGGAATERDEILAYRNGLRAGDLIGAIAVALETKAKVDADSRQAREKRSAEMQKMFLDIALAPLDIVTLGAGSKVAGAGTQAAAKMMNKFESEARKVLSRTLHEALTKVTASPVSGRPESIFQIQTEFDQAIRRILSAYEANGNKTIEDREYIHLIKQFQMGLVYQRNSNQQTFGILRR